MTPDSRPHPDTPAPADTAARWRMALLTLAVALTILSLMPGPLSMLDSDWSVLKHVLAFVPLGITACRGFARSSRATCIALLAVVAFGGLTELLQLLVDGRAARLTDMVADSIGAAIGAFLALALWPATHELRERWRSRVAGSLARSREAVEVLTVVDAERPEWRDTQPRA